MSYKLVTLWPSTNWDKQCIHLLPIKKKNVRPHDRMQQHEKLCCWYAGPIGGAVTLAQNDTENIECCHFCYLWEWGAWDGVMMSLFLNKTWLAWPNQHSEIYLLWNPVSKMIVSGFPSHWICVDSQPKRLKTFVDIPNMASVWTEANMINRAYRKATQSNPMDNAGVK